MKSHIIKKLLQTQGKLTFILLLTGLMNTPQGKGSEVPDLPFESSFVLKFATNFQQNIEISMRRFERPEAQPIIVSHALILSNIGMRKLGLLLWNAGYDVWLPNMRGHGNGKERTVVVPYNSGDYSFDNMVTEDAPLIFDWIANTTQQKPHLIGFSMGGMVWEQYLSGVYKENGQVRQSDALAISRNKKISSFTSITTPPDFEKVSKSVKVLLYPIWPVSNFFHVFIPLSANLDPEDKSFSLFGWGREVLISGAHNIFTLLLPRGIIERRNDDPRISEFYRLAAYEISSPHSDYISDFLTWMYRSYRSRNSVVDFATNKKVSAPMLVFAATEDRLAPGEQILAKLKLFPNASSIKAVTMKGFAHIDVIFESGLSLMGPDILEFLASKAAISSLKPQNK